MYARALQRYSSMVAVVSIHDCLHGFRCSSSRRQGECERGRASPASEVLCPAAPPPTARIERSGIADSGEKRYIYRERCQARGRCVETTFIAMSRVCASVLIFFHGGAAREVGDIHRRPSSHCAAREAACCRLLFDVVDERRDAQASCIADAQES